MLLIKIGMPVHFGSEINQVSGFGHPGSILVEGMRGIWINQCTFYDGAEWTNNVVVPGMYILVSGSAPAITGIIKSLEKDALVVLFDYAVGYASIPMETFTPDHYSSVTYKFSRDRQNWEWAW